MHLIERNKKISFLCIHSMCFNLFSTVIKNILRFSEQHGGNVFNK